MSYKPSLLWSIQREDLPGTSYLFGTMHVHDVKAFGLINQVKTLLHQCDAMAAEYDLDNHSEMEVSRFTDFSKSKTVIEVLPEKTLQKLNRVLLKSLGLSLDGYQHMHPFVLINTISSLILSKDMPLSLDEHLWHEAKAIGKETTGIETLEEQLAIVEKIPIDAHVKNLTQIAENFPRYRLQTLKMANWYANENLTQLHRASINGQGKLKRLLLYNRNTVMATRIEKMASARTVFFAIGAGHLGGKQGILRKLKILGLKVKSLSAGE